MRFDRRLWGAAVLGISLALAGCNGGSITGGGGSGTGGTTGSTTGGTTGNATAAAAHLLLQSSNSTINSGTGTGSTVTVTATVTDSSNVTVSGAVVSFASDGGALTPSGSVTDGNGQLTATLSSGGATAGTIIKVTATAGSLSQVAAITVASGTPDYAMGTLTGTTFTAGQIAVGQSSLAAGGSAGLQLSIVDRNKGNAPITSSATVSFSSPCQSLGQAQIVSPITSASGTFSTTYTASGCSGADTITAVATVDGTALSATGTVTVEPPTLGSIQFLSATPTTIGLRGESTGLPESGQVTFKVLDSNGNPINGQSVSFGLTTTVGGLSVSPTTATTDADGEVTTTVQSGTVHTPVRVVATTSGTGGTVLTSQSSQLNVSTGFPAQNGFSLSASSLNIEGNDIDGIQSTITARLSDRYNNPVPDGTAVSFTTECGQIQPECTTTDGACSVTFTSQAPRTGALAALGTATYSDNNCGANPNGLGCDDHRCTVLAYAIGEESFNDCNGTGYYVSKQNPANNASQCPNGDFFVSLPEAFLDSNENGVRNGNSETFIDFSQNGAYDAASGEFVGILCDPANGNCSTANSLNVRGSLVIVMASSSAIISATPSPITVDPAGATSVSVEVTDTAGEIMPVGTTISATTSYGSLVAPSSFTVPNSDVCPSSVANCAHSGAFGTLPVYLFTLKGSGSAGSGILTITVTSPRGLVTYQQVSVVGQAPGP